MGSGVSRLAATRRSLALPRKRKQKPSRNSHHSYAYSTDLSCTEDGMDFQIGVLESLLSSQEGRLQVLRHLGKSESDMHLVRFIAAVNEYEERFETGENSEYESLTELEKFVRRIVDLYLLDEKTGEYRTTRLREEIIDLVLEGEFHYLFLAREDALRALVLGGNVGIRKMTSAPPPPPMRF